MLLTISCNCQSYPLCNSVLTKQRGRQVSSQDYPLAPFPLFTQTIAALLGCLLLSTVCISSFASQKRERSLEWKIAIRKSPRHIAPYGAKVHWFFRFKELARLMLSWSSIVSPTRRLLAPPTNAPSKISTLHPSNQE